MANSVLNVTYKTKKTGSGTQDLTKEMGQAKMGLADMKAGLDLAGQAFNAVKGAVESVINPTVEYAGQIRELQRTIGSTAEESSKLIQAADDVGISAGTLQGALEAAIKRGVKPTIEGIGELADEYNAIKDPIARTKFLMDNFGRSGADLAPLMAQGAEGIRAAGEEAERLGLVMGQDGVDAARQYEIAMDDFNDSVLAVKLAIAENLLPAVTSLLDTGSQQVQLWKSITEAVGEHRLGLLDYLKLSAQVVWTDKTLADAVDELTDSQKQGRSAARDATDGFAGLAEQYDTTTLATVEFSNQIQSQTQWLNDLAGPAREVKDSIDELANANMRLSAALDGAVGEEVRNYTESQADLEKQIADTRAEIDKYTRMSGQTVTVVTDTEEAQRNLTIAMAAQETAAGTLAEAQQKLSENTDPDKQLQLEAAVARAQGALNNAAGEVGEWNSALATSGGTYVTDYSTAIDEATGKLGELEQAAADNAAAHELATEKILFGYLQQALAVDGLTLDEIHALTSVGEQWGILDSDTATAVDGILGAAEDLANGGDLATFQNQVNGVRDSILGVPTDWTTTFHVNQDGQVPTYTPNGGNSNAFANGVTDFVVPPGYPNDSFPMFVQSGEVVNVTPAGQSSSQGGGVTVNGGITINAPGATANELYAMLQANDIRRRTGARS